jgi:small subunit ribosomal protein S4e
MSHLKRISIERSWPLPRKGSKYMLKAYPGKKSELSMPLGIILRDIIKITSKRKETKAVLQNKEVHVNGKIVREEKFPLMILDTLSLPKLGKHFILTLNESGKIVCEEISAKESESKVCKIIGQRILKKGIKQINCIDGRNFILKEKAAINDSLLLDLKENKITKVLPFKTGSEVLVIGGAHMGEKGKISETGERIKVHIKNKNFDIQAKNIVVLK